MPPAGFEVAIEHVTEHSGILDPPGSYREFELIGDVMGEAFIGGMLCRGLLLQQFKRFGRFGPRGQLGQKKVLVQDDVPLQHHPKRIYQRHCQGDIWCPGKLIGHVLELIAKPPFAGMLVADPNKQVLTGLFCGINSDHAFTCPAAFSTTGICVPVARFIIDLGQESGG